MVQGTSFWGKAQGSSSMKRGQVVRGVVIYLGKKVNKNCIVPKLRGLVHRWIRHWLRLKRVGGMHGSTILNVYYG